MAVREDHGGTKSAMFAVVLIILFAGCAAVGPEYEPPSVEAPQTWSSDLRKGLQAAETDPLHLSSWWKCFNDPLLTELIDQAVKQNLDLKNARARLREARARRGIRNADRFPTLEAGGSVTTGRSSAETGAGRQTDLFAAGFDASWELDLFGSIRRSLELADADLAASQENVHDVMVSLAAEVALNYIELRSFQTRLDIARANRDRQHKTYQLVQHRYEAGLASPLEVEQARYNFESTRSDIPTLETGLTGAKNRLAVLLGQAPGALESRLGDHQPIPLTPSEVAVGVPADVLRRRPDVRRAERELAAQTAQIGVATADLYPKFRLFGSIGLESLSAGSLLNSANRTYSFGPGVSWRIFDASRIRNTIEVETARQEQALIAYEAAILKALEEVENALAAYAGEQERLNSLKVASQSAQRAVEKARHQYQAGLVDFQNVLETERSLLAFQDQLAVSEAQVTSNLIRLYKSLGGGWQSLAGDQSQ